MATVKVYNHAGKEVSTLTLDDAVFGVAVQESLVHEAVVSQQANARTAIAHAKDRSEVRGGGRKPWRQKGTGRARHGSRRSPIWIGGGITFGPSKVRNFARKMNKKARRKALFMTLSDKVTDNALLVLENLELKEGKTKVLDQILKALPKVGKRVLIVVDAQNIAVRRAAQNLPFIETIAPNSMNVVDIMKADTVVTSVDGVETLTRHFTQA